MKYIKLYETFIDNNKVESKSKLTDILNSLSEQEIRTDIVKGIYYDQGITTITLKFDNFSVRRDQALGQVYNWGVKLEKRFGESIFCDYFIYEEEHSLTKVNSNKELIYKIFTKVFEIHNAYSDLRGNIIKDIMIKYGFNKEMIKDLDERIEEFEVIKNYKIDTISLNTLYDFLDLDFSDHVNESYDESNERELRVLYHQFSNQELRTDIKFSQYYDNGGANIRYQIPELELVVTKEFEHDKMYRRYILTYKHEYYSHFELENVERKGKDIYNQLKRLYNYNNEFTLKVIRDLCVVISKTEGRYLNHEQLLKIVLERMDEFEVIKNYQVDYISLSSLYEFYDKTFNEDEFLFDLNKILKDHA